MKQIRLNFSGEVNPDLGLVLSEWFNSPFFGRTPESAGRDFLKVFINGIPCKSLFSSLLEDHFNYQLISFADEYLIASTGLPNSFQLVDNWINTKTNVIAQLSVDGKQWTQKSPNEILDILIHRQLLGDLQGLIPSSPTDCIPTSAKWLDDTTVISTLCPTTNGQTLRTSLIGDLPDGICVSPYLFPALQLLLSEATSIFPAPWNKQLNQSNYTNRSLFNQGVRTKIRVWISLIIVRLALHLPKLLAYRLHAWTNQDRALDTWRISEFPLSRSNWKQIKNRGSIRT